MTQLEAEIKRSKPNTTCSSPAACRGCRGKRARGRRADEELRSHAHPEHRRSLPLRDPADALRQVPGVVGTADDQARARAPDAGGPERAAEPPPRAAASRRSKGAAAASAQPATIRRSRRDRARSACVRARDRSRQGAVRAAGPGARSKSGEISRCRSSGSRRWCKAQVKKLEAEGQDVAFRVAVKDGKVTLTAKPVKRMKLKLNLSFERGSWRTRTGAGREPGAGGSSG